MLRAVAAFATVFACISCNAVDATDDPLTLRDRLDRALCSSHGLDDVTKHLKGENVQYFLDHDKKILTAKKSFNEEKLVSSAVVVEIQFDDKGVVGQCKVQVLHTGP